MKILLVNFEMFRQVIDPLGQKGYLHLGGTGVALMPSVFADGLVFVVHGLSFPPLGLEIILYGLVSYLQWRSKP
jgi:hypothetical protein